MTHSRIQRFRFLAFSSCRVAFAGVLLGLLIGCGGSGPSNYVTGKVTMNGQAVGGTIVFVGSDGKTKEAPLDFNDGKYVIGDPPKGAVDILVKGMLPMGTGMAPKDSAAMPGVGTGPKTGVAPPAKYAQPGEIPKFTVTSGKQVHDIVLTP